MTTSRYNEISHDLYGTLCRWYDDEDYAEMTSSDLFAAAFCWISGYSPNIPVSEAFDLISVTVNRYEEVRRDKFFKDFYER